MIARVSSRRATSRAVLGALCTGMRLILTESESIGNRREQCSCFSLLQVPLSEREHRSRFLAHNEEHPMNALHVVVGAGPVGRATALELAARGHEVALLSRSGRGPEVPGCTREPVDAAD